MTDAQVKSGAIATAVSLVLIVLMGMTVSTCSAVPVRGHTSAGAPRWSDYGDGVVRMKVECGHLYTSTGAYRPEFVPDGSCGGGQ